MTCAKKNKNPLVTYVKFETQRINFLSNVCMYVCMYVMCEEDIPYLLIKPSLNQKMGRHARVETVVQSPL